MGALRSLTGCKTLLGSESESNCVDVLLKDKSTINLGNISVIALHTPGHTKDSYSFYVRDALHGYVLTGDTLLIRGSGRTDFQNGDTKEQYSSILTQLFSLPDETIVLPGHDYRGWNRSTIAEEKAHNPRLQVKNAIEYEELMKNLNFANPKLMDIAIPINQNCGKKIN
ncbi:MAG: sulfur dioxygenase [Flavobacteriales bacterium]